MKSLGNRKQNSWVIETVIEKFNKSSKISADDMKLCNKLWAQYEK